MFHAIVNMFHICLKLDKRAVDTLPRRDYPFIVGSIGRDSPERCVR